MRIGLLTEGGYPYVSGDASLWCDRLVRGLEQHEFDIYALSRSERQEDEGWIPLPPQVSRVRTAPLWTAEEDGVAHGRRARRRFAEHYGELVASLCEGGAARAPRERSDAEADRFAGALYGLAELARDEGGLVGALRSEAAVRALERVCRAPGAPRAAREARVPDLLAVATHLEHVLRPLSLDWYEDEGLLSVDLCHAAAGGSAALPGLLARHFAGVPLLVTEYGVRLRAHYLTAAGAAPAVRALLAAFHGSLTAETYTRAAIVTPGNAHARRWQERCGADRDKLRTVYPGMAAAPFAGVGEATQCADPDTLVWVGRVEPTKDLVSLLHAFGEIRREEPKARLRIVGAPGGPEGAAYLDHCKAVAAQLFPEGEGGHGSPVDGACAGGANGQGARAGGPAGGGLRGGGAESGGPQVGGSRVGGSWVGGAEGGGADGGGSLADRPGGDGSPDGRSHSDGPHGDQPRAIAPHVVGEPPVSFEEIGGPELPTPADAYASGAVTVLSSVVEGFPLGLVEAMLCGRATVSTDVGAVVEVIGGTGLVVPPRNPQALAEACVALMRDPERRARLGAAARARALELFTVEQNITAFHGIYLEIVSRTPVRRVVLDDTGEPLPFAAPAESHVPGTWTERGVGAGVGAGVKGRAMPGWAAGPPVRATAPAAVPVGEGTR